MFFSAFERMLALRYLRARRQEGFISVIAVISLLGIALGVATLIIVMAVMNGFRQELLSRILGVNGHLTVYADAGPIEDYEDFAQRLTAFEGVLSRSRPRPRSVPKAALPASSRAASTRRFCRDAP
jgi:lipoprotein-releasing system permease protein